MLRRSLAVALTSVLLVTACSSGESEPSSTTTTPAAKTGFATVGADEWDEPQQWRAGDLPVPPEGSSAAQLEQMAGIIDQWSRTALFKPEVLQGKDVVKNVVASLPPIVQQRFAQQVADTPGPQLSSGNVFSAKPSGLSRASSVWKVDMAKAPDGSPAVRLRLQVRAVYPFGDQLIGTIRDFGVTTPAGSAVGEVFGLSGRWYAYGADPCELINSDVMAPLADKAAATKDLGLYSGIVAKPEFQEPEDIDVRSPEELKDAC